MLDNLILTAAIHEPQYAAPHKIDLQNTAVPEPQSMTGLPIQCWQVSLAAGLVKQVKGQAINNMPAATCGHTWHRRPKRALHGDLSRPKEYVESQSPPSTPYPAPTCKAHQVLFV